jgi:hypothetical protein
MKSASRTILKEEDPIGLPDFTSQVSIIGQIIDKLKVDIVAQTVGNLKVDISAQSISTLGVDIKAQSLGNINVNIAASAVRLDINIAAQSVNVTVLAPQARAVGVAPGLILKTGSRTVYGLQPYTEYVVGDIYGRGRLVQVGGWLSRGNSHLNLWDFYVRVYIDGETTPSIQLRVDELDILNGYQVWGMPAESTGITYNYPAVLGKIGGITYQKWDAGAGDMVELGFMLSLDVEFSSEVKVAILSQSGSVTSPNTSQFIVDYAYGFYP